MIFEQSNWRPPEELPTWLLDADTVAIDTETYDPQITTKGPGYCRGDGKLLGVALAARRGVGQPTEAYYLPVAHAGDNLDERMVLAFVRDLASKEKTFVFANACYDLGWLRRCGVQFHANAKIRDVQVAEPLLNEERQDGYSLDILSKHYLDFGKWEATLEELERSGFSKNIKGSLGDLPARFVGQYAEMDARCTLEIYEHQLPAIKAEGLEQLFELESAITPICLEMTWRGVRVDLTAAEKLNQEMLNEQRNISSVLHGLDVWSTSEVGKFLEANGVAVPRTDKGNYSATKQFLEHSGSPLAAKIRSCRELDRIRKTFVDDGILHGHIRGRVHAQFIQMAREEGGTRSGRFSSQNPNLQQVPSRSEWGKRVRALYIPEDGEKWLKCDYSSQEPRMQVHFALEYKYEKAIEAAQAFEPDPKTGKPGKLYSFIEKTVPGITYDQAKIIFLGLSYGMGVKKLAASLGVSVDEARAILDKVNRFVPFINQLSKRCAGEAAFNGYIQTIFGRKRRFNWFVADTKDARATAPIYGKEKAEKAFEKEIANGYKLVRTYTHMALNAKIQGSSADQTKKAMLDCFNAGYIPLLQCHDELCFSISDEKDVDKIKYMMENAIKLNLPTVADCTLKTHW